MKKPTVTIGIPVYQFEGNIKQLLLSLVKQQERRIQIKEIITYYDGCTDLKINGNIKDICWIHFY
jgi:hypothetical protein